MLLNMSVLTKKAKEQGYGIAAACPMGTDQISWCFETASEMNSPLILNNRSKLFDLSIESVAEVVRFYAKKYDNVPCALNLDHGTSYEDAARAIKAGYTGVMVDKSMYSDDENIRTMKQVVRMAHASDVGVEAAIGGTTWRDPTEEEILANLTKVDAFTRLVEETKVDMVAVFVGGSHGDNKTGPALLHYDLIEQLRDASEAQLVFHGSSFAGDENLARAARCGISKFNVAGDLFAGGAASCIAYAETGETDLKQFELEMKKGYKHRLAEFMTFLGSAGRI